MYFYPESQVFFKKFYFSHLTDLDNNIIGVVKSCVLHALKQMKPS